MLNKVQLIGRLGVDPELTTARSGTAICKLRLATTDRRKDKDGNWNEHTEWHRVTCFGTTATNVDRFCRKGKLLFIEGKISTTKYQDKEGKDRWSTEVIANDVKFLSPKDEDSSGGGGGGGSGENYSGGGGNYAADDDIPF